MIHSGNPAHTEPHSLLRLSATFGQSVVILFSKLDLRRKQSVTNAIYSVFVCARARVCVRGGRRAEEERSGFSRARARRTLCEDAVPRACSPVINERVFFFFLLHRSPPPTWGHGHATRSRARLNHAPRPPKFHGRTHL